MCKYLFLFTACLYGHFSNAQNVGIGVSNPQSKLHIGGGFRLDTLTGVGGAGLLWHNPNGVVYGIKFTGNTNDVLRGDGSFGSFSGSGISYWSDNGTHIYNNNSGNVGIGTTTPGSGLELRGTGLQTQQRITDNTSGNSLVLQAGAGNNLKITGYNYSTNTAQPLYLSVDGANTLLNANGGNVGIGTTTPFSKLSVNSNLFGISQTNGTVTLSTYLSIGAGWFGTYTNHPLHFYTNNSEAQMTLNQAGQLGIGTTTPLGGYRLDISGPVRSFDNTTHFVAQTTGGTNSWARYYMRSNAQSWFMGTSQNFNGNQLYIGDETFNQTRFSIQPNGGPINMQGNVTQNLTGYGLPKAMVYVNGDGTIIRSFNGITGSTGQGSGITAIKLGSGQYQVDFGFYIGGGFYSVSLDNSLGNQKPVGISFTPGGSYLFIYIFETNQVGPLGEVIYTDRPFIIIVY